MAGSLVVNGTSNGSKFKPVPWPKKFCGLILLLTLFHYSGAQNYHAINGSAYAGSLGSSNNPASIVHVPYAWDITPLAFQFKQSTNAFRIEKYSFLSSPDNSEYAVENGTKRRFVFANQDIRILNTRISLNAKAAIAFGANLRNYAYVTTGTANYQDTSFTLADFMKINTGHQPLSGEFTGSAWAELFATYAQTVVDDGDRMLNAGLSLKLTRSLAGGYTRARGLSYVPEFVSGRPAYLLTAGSLQYGYSGNFDAIDSNNTAATNRRLFLANPGYGISADFGFEYIFLAAEDQGEASDYAYNTKIGVSVMDIGAHRYQYGSRSRLAIAGKPGVTDTVIENSISPVTSFDTFNDSLGAISGSLTRLGGEFVVYQPTRITVNVDQHLTGNFFLNAGLTLPLVSLAGRNTLFIKSLDLLALTPRWELRSMGAYLPLLLNTRKQIWVGAAFKAGPLLFGTHNLSGLFSKNKAHRGGMYLALTIRPGRDHGRLSRYPRVKLPANEQRSLTCPRF